MSRVHPGGTRAVDDLTLTVADAELLVIIGPSGCGKTTTLRMVAGLDAADEGTIRFDGQSVEGLPPRDRDVAMVTQDHALYRHLDVEGNLGFGLSLQKLAPAEVRRRVTAEARALGLTRLLGRRADTLSAGEGQAVAVGRATARLPSLFLMDEPLARLDAARRPLVRRQILALQRGLAATMLYVTNDPVEAMALGNRLAVLRDGRLQQLGAPTELYESPRSVFVAQMLGMPEINLFDAILDIDGDSGWLWLGNRRMPFPGRVPPLLRAYDGATLTVGARPEQLRLVGPGVDGLDATVERVAFIGSHHVVHCQVDQEPRPARRLQARVDSAPRRGERVRLAADAVLLFDATSGAALWRSAS